MTVGQRGLSKNTITDKIPTDLKGPAGNRRACPAPASPRVTQLSKGMALLSAASPAAKTWAPPDSSALGMPSEPAPTAGHCTPAEVLPSVPPGQCDHIGLVQGCGLGLHGCSTVSWGWCQGQVCTYTHTHT